jgi:hypothetical protein
VQIVWNNSPQILSLRTMQEFIQMWETLWENTVGKRFIQTQVMMRIWESTQAKSHLYAMNVANVLPDQTTSNFTCRHILEISGFHVSYVITKLLIHATLIDI